MCSPTCRSDQLACSSSLLPHALPCFPLLPLTVPPPPPQPSVLPSLPESPVTFSFSDALRYRNDRPAVEALDAGQTASLLCEVGQPATLAWTFEGGLLPSNTLVQAVSANSSRLTIINATLDNGGTYTCIGHLNDMPVNVAGVVNLEVYGGCCNLLSQPV